MKVNKGYNGRRRKIERRIAKMRDMFADGATFDELYQVFEPLTHLAGDIPADDPIHKAMCKALDLIHSTAYMEYEAEVVSEYWASVS